MPTETEVGFSALASGSIEIPSTAAGVGGFIEATAEGSWSMPEQSEVQS
jgi:hypothetical protein